MSLARTWAVALVGAHGELVEIEADLSNQTPDFRIIGLPDKALAEAVQRVHNACANSDLELPRRRITINLSPASLPKHGSAFDVGIAVAALATRMSMDAASLARTVHVGELGLDGRLRPVAGVLPAVLSAARAGYTHAVVPHANLAEAALVDGIEVLGAVNLSEVAAWHGASVEVRDDTPLALSNPGSTDEPPPELADVIGQRDAVHALITAAAGGHHLLMCGPPGAGKTMLARRLPGILPPLDDDAALAAASLRSLSGARVTALNRTPPFESPHHSASVAALVGGGSRILRPGAIARASEGVLFLDEAGEFHSGALDALRQPLEQGSISIDRAGSRVVFPARFQLVLATNPCPCGNYGVRGSSCTCPPMSIRRYLGRLSGPLRDRIDIELAMARVSHTRSTPTSREITTAQARSMVAEARARARVRLAETPWQCNAHVSGAWLRDGPFAPDMQIRRPLDAALHRGALTLRGFDRVLRVAWSIADLGGRDRLTSDDIGRAMYLKNGVAA
ncbi:YifB family Mg chelatase-like AAA ATPase [Microbacterium sp. C7(2022)]|uniref:YifB family Mg chelatase-like AAA ATPase n=1 Tax=Microbacterium sp. C7(2022) TaxID=2992759 RepID=UPI00237C0EA4|nr:YifB family Mg chelatase-like AAA ATPase [Microbacterium sp. C7(2022)]MDE0546910.1 YifB family Mg chelatase-like AAA ATPase [Microbacterium sp. C7(2022)]